MLPGYVKKLLGFLTLAISVGSVVREPLRHLTFLICTWLEIRRHFMNY